MKKDQSHLQHRIDTFLERKSREYPELDGYVNHIERI